MSNDQERPEAARARTLVASYYADPARRLAAARDMFNRSARYYDVINLLFSLGSGAWYRRACLRKAGVRPGTRVVDVAVGTGLLAREAAGLVGDRHAVIGVDVSEAMLAIARHKLGIPIIQAAAEALPLAPATADFVTMGYALRHVADLGLAFSEALRVLRPGGRIVLLEISAPGRRMNRMLAAAYIGGVLPLLSLLMTRDRRGGALMRYHWRTIAESVPPDVIMRVMTESGFCDVACASEFDLFRLYIGEKPGAAT